MKPAPVALFVYKRPEHTQKVLESLQKNSMAKETDIFIYCDGPKNKEDREKIDQVTQLFNGVKGFSSITLRTNPVNKGLAGSIIDGVSERLRYSDKIIVLEDDIVTSKYFLEYMNKALYLYEKKEEVISIHGYVYPGIKNLPESFFLRGADCWGWGTWRRGWDIFEPDGEKLLKQLQESDDLNDFSFNNSYPYLQMLKDQISGKNNSWAIRWYASAFLKQKLTLYPGRSLVKNIGFDGSGTHCGIDGTLKCDFNDQEFINLKKIECIENKDARRKFEQYFNSNNKRRLFQKLKDFIKVISIKAV